MPGTRHSLDKRGSRQPYLRQPKRGGLRGKAPSGEAAGTITAAWAAPRCPSHSGTRPEAGAPRELGCTCPKSKVRARKGIRGKHQDKKAKSDQAKAQEPHNEEDRGQMGSSKAGPGAPVWAGSWAGRAGDELRDQDHGETKLTQDTPCTGLLFVGDRWSNS